MADFAKKLTVSFGAFSCTLSGFDDPFPVMSQVVDYFQKLSKSDPSFGAHPERPDTEALRVLAEKTSGLAVGAEMLGDEVVLSSVPDEIEDEFSAAEVVPASPANDQELPETVEAEKDTTSFETGIAAQTTAPEVLADAASVESDPVAESKSETSPVEVTPPVEETTSTETEAEQSPTAQNEPDLPQEDINSVVSKAFADAKTFEEPQTLEPTENALADEHDLVELDAGLETAPEENIDTAPVDMFAQLQIDDLDDEVFDNIDADDIYDPITPSAKVEHTPFENEDVSGYLNEAVAFTDIDNPDEEDLLVQTPEDVTDQAPSSEFDPVPVWEAELVSDEPIEAVSEIPEAAFEGDDLDNGSEEDGLSYDEHVAAEQTALARILAATQESDDLADEVALSGDDAELVESNASAQEEIEEPFIGEDAAETARSLVLGFGAAASLDATHDVETSMLDNRTKPAASEALAAMGIYEEEDQDFGWAADDDAPQEVVQEEKAEAAPLLLTPMQQVTPVEETYEVVEQESPSSAIDMDQDDPRADLRRFADAAGAVSLPELLEASAAYSTLVNHRPSFSRGEVLDLLDEFSDEEGFSQEARIKTFGSLLRGGRIQRVENGEYEMTIDALSEYDQARKAG